LARCARSFYRAPMELDRRSAPRTPAHLYFNKYIDGVPHLCEALEISMTGMLVRRVHEPDEDLACYAVEIGLPGVDEVDPEAPTPPAGEVADEDEPAEAACGDDGDAATRPGRLWLCATSVWQEGRYQALAFVGHSALDRLRLADLMAELRGPAVAMRAGAGDAFVGEA
jgi:hypothetical protein